MQFVVLNNSLYHIVELRYGNLLIFAHLQYHHLLGVKEDVYQALSRYLNFYLSYRFHRQTEFKASRHPDHIYYIWIYNLRPYNRLV